MEQPTTTEIYDPHVDDESNLRVKLVRSSKFWFEDGNIVLQAEHTQFRLHRSVLSIHSRVFRDMFACSQPENGPMIDGCPLVYLSETLEDVKNFVKILYRPIMTYNRTDLVSVSLLRTMLHFGTKYEMKRLRSEAVHCLMSEFPSSLHRWSDQAFGDVIESFDSDEIPLTSLFEILYLAHEHSITGSLPALYLRICLTYDAQAINEGFQCAAKNSPLNNKLLLNCLLGRERLHRSVSSLTLAWLHDNSTLSSPDCKTPSPCQKKKSMLITELWDNDIQFSISFALHPWEDLGLGDGLCLSCRGAAKVAYCKARITNWDQLKTYFGLCDLEHEPEAPSDSDSDSSDSAADAVEEEAGL